MKIGALMSFNKGLSQENGIHNHPGSPDCYHPHAWFQNPHSLHKFRPF